MYVHMYNWLNAHSTTWIEVDMSEVAFTRTGTIHGMIVGEEKEMESIPHAEGVACTKYNKNNSVSNVGITPVLDIT